MKHLSNYTEQATTDLLNKTGAFFAFSNKQYEEAAKPNVEYVQCSNQAIVPKENARELTLGLSKIYEQGIAQDIKENGIKAIIHRELANHEAGYTYELEDTVDALAGYGITEEQVRAEFSEYLIGYEEANA